jgi:hypothetical protein
MKTILSWVVLVALSLTLWLALMGQLGAGAKAAVCAVCLLGLWAWVER